MKPRNRRFWYTGAKSVDQPWENYFPYHMPHWVFDPRQKILRLQMIELGSSLEEEAR